MYTFLVAFILACFSILYIWIRRRYQYWTDRGFLQSDGSFPLGSLKGVGTKMSSTEKYDQIYKEFKGRGQPVVGFYNFLSPAIMPLEPEIIKDILVRDFQSFHDRGLFYNKKDDPVSAKYV